MSASATVAQTGASYRNRPSGMDDVETPAQSFRVYFKNTQLGGATSPTSQAKLQSSYDGTTWFDVAQSTQLTADTSKGELVDITAFGPYVRVITLVGGSTAPAHTVEARLVSNAPFTIAAA